MCFANMAAMPSSQRDHRFSGFSFQISTQPKFAPPPPPDDYLPDGSFLRPELFGWFLLLRVNNWIELSVKTGKNENTRRVCKQWTLPTIQNDNKPYCMSNTGHGS